MVARVLYLHNTCLDRYKEKDKVMFLGHPEINPTSAEKPTLFIRSTSNSAFLAHFCQKSGSSISISSSPLDDTKLAYKNPQKDRRL